MDYAVALQQLLKEKPDLNLEAQRVFFDSASDLSDPEHPSLKINSYERIYKTIKAIADEKTVKV